ncbi:hypothetical protein PGT21_033006 [Puccinia graminis f. sp. tritici]|uniref:Uncharacterized protein n=1 Tax=Puccinia graminis f. sp. tritici TaxID=56615 RepID=A0A5B0NF21_PUCGR|nr:hypothetical protein PGT21_033006 [Puccinia graminis f. sp. tritici]KAA1086379.1 hypothetical protein PGTUg99_020765 [Puccinia graminis f. sp. tritici]
MYTLRVLSAVMLVLSVVCIDMVASARSPKCNMVKDKNQKDAPFLVCKSILDKYYNAGQACQTGEKSSCCTSQVDPTGQLPQSCTPIQG